MPKKKHKAGDQCHGCSGTGMQCQCCTHPLDDCECGPDAEPVTCEICEGKGSLDEFAADLANSLDEAEA